MINWHLTHGWIADLRLCARAAVAVATSPPMPAADEYIRLVENLRPQLDSENPAAIRLLGQLQEAISRWKVQTPEGIEVPRLAASLISFVDDYEGQFPAEYFPENLVMRVLDDLDGARAGSITIARLLQLDTLRSAPSFFDAVVAAHAAVRLLARGRDTRAFPRFKGTLPKRVLQGAAIAPFSRVVSHGGDPLGDTYHYLANLAIGLAFSPSRPLTWCTAATFGVGPELMTTIRERLFGSRLFYGNHARIDRMGLSHGLWLALRRSTPSRTWRPSISGSSRRSIWRC